MQSGGLGRCTQGNAGTRIQPIFIPCSCPITHTPSRLPPHTHARTPQSLDPALNELLSHPDWERFETCLPRFYWDPQVCGLGRGAGRKGTGGKGARAEETQGHADVRVWQTGHLPGIRVFACLLCSYPPHHPQTPPLLRLPCLLHLPCPPRLPAAQAQQEVIAAHKNWEALRAERAAAKKREAEELAAAEAAAAAATAASAVEGGVVEGAAAADGAAAAPAAEVVA